MIIDTDTKKYAVALGFFDGLHKAHMQVLNVARSLSEKGFVPAVILFDEHPRKVITGDDIPLLLEDSKRDDILIKMGIECLYVSFRDIMNMSPEEFIDKILIKKFNAGAVVSGFNYRFGKNGEGDSDTLRELCIKKGIEAIVCPEYFLDGESVSSTKIRKAIESGDIASANRLLGYEFTYSAEVFSGDKRGRTLGTPTINQYFPKGLIIPRFGVYAVRIFIDGKEYKGVANVGCRPTFGESSVRSETYIIDFEGDLYGKTVEVRLCNFIREEKRFADTKELKQQIGKDVLSAKAYFSV